MSNTRVYHYAIHQGQGHIKVPSDVEADFSDVNVNERQIFCDVDISMLVKCFIAANHCSTAIVSWFDEK